METKKEYFPNKEQRFLYMMLGRLIQDTKYFFQHNSEKHLWAGSKTEQINALKEVYYKIIEKPQWCTEEQLNYYINILKN